MTIVGQTCLLSKHFEWSSIFSAEEMASKGVRVRPMYSERLSFVVGYRQDVRENVLDRAGPKARRDLQAAFGG